MRVDESCCNAADRACVFVYEVNEFGTIVARGEVLLLLPAGFRKEFRSEYSRYNKEIPLITAIMNHDTPDFFFFFHRR